MSVCENYENTCQRNKHIIKVTDSGEGIRSDVQQKMYNPFFTTKEVGKGTGLGISISKNIIETHKGQFYIDKDCLNTRFVIRLPLTQDKIKSA